MKASGIMTRDPLTIASSADVYEAAKLMEEHDIRHLPVVDEGDLVGVLSERNVLEASGWAFPAAGRDVTIVRENMHIPVETTQPHVDVAAVCRQLAEWRIGSLPVVEKGTLAGIITDVDLLKAFASHCDHTEGDDPPVSACMTSGVATIENTAPVADAIEMMKEHRIRHVPVVEGDKVTGLISDRDIRLLLGQGLPHGMPVSGMASLEVCSITPDRPLSEAAEVLLMRKIGALVVLEDERLVGMITSLDIIEHGATIDWS